MISSSPLPSLIAKYIASNTALLGVGFPVQKPFSHQEFTDVTFLRATHKEIGTSRIM